MTTRKATTTATTDPYGMTTRKASAKASNCKSRQLQKY
jgi:hypothetical protein